MARLQLTGLSKTYGDVEAVADVDLDIRQGELVVLLGPSGCGKTTTLRMIAGFVEPTAGEIRLGGNDITNRPPWKRNTGLVFQSYALFPHLSVADNVAFGLRMRKLAPSEIEAKLARPWAPPMSESYPANAKAEGWWYAASGSLMYSFYNTDLVKEADAPKSWKDVLDAKWKRKLATSPISIGGTAWLQYAYLLDHFGAAYLKGFVAQEPKLFTAYNPAVLAVARGEELIGVGAAVNEYPARVGQGAPLKPVYPPEGLPYTNYPMVQLAGAPHPHAGELFGNWYLSKLGQSQLVKVRGAYSVRADVAPAPSNPPLAEVKPWNPGHDAIIKRHDAVIEEVNRIFEGR